MPHDEGTSRTVCSPGGRICTVTHAGTANLFSRSMPSLGCEAIDWPGFWNDLSTPMAKNVSIHPSLLDAGNGIRQRTRSATAVARRSSYTGKLAVSPGFRLTDHRHAEGGQGLKQMVLRAGCTVSRLSGETPISAAGLPVQALLPNGLDAAQSMAFLSVPETE